MGSTLDAEPLARLCHEELVRRIALALQDGKAKPFKGVCRDRVSAVSVSKTVLFETHGGVHQEAFRPT